MRKTAPHLEKFIKIVIDESFKKFGGFGEMTHEELQASKRIKRIIDTSVKKFLQNSEEAQDPEDREYYKKAIVQVDIGTPGGLLGIENKPRVMRDVSAWMARDGLSGRWKSKDTIIIDLNKHAKRSIVSESMKGPSDIPAGTRIVCKHEPGIGGSVSFRTLVPRARPQVVGSVSWDDGGAGRPNVVTGAYADKGWGPLLYDIAIELAGTNGMMADRVSVSPEARAIWDYYMRKRPDIEHMQWDNRWNELTPSPKDNIEQLSAEEDPTAPRWRDSSLSKAYRRRVPGTPVIDALASLDKIVIDQGAQEDE